MLWAYLSFSQFLIIWSGNLPEEIPWYMRRLYGGWGAIAVLLVLFHFFVPFVILLQRLVKRDPSLLQKVALWMIVIRLIDVFWVVMPAFSQKEFKGHGFAISWMDFAAPLGLGGLLDRGLYLESEEVSARARRRPAPARHPESNGGGTALRCPTNTFTTFPGKRTRTSGTN